MSQRSNNNNNNNKRGIDTLLNSLGKTLSTGEEIRFTLVKGPRYTPVPDPVNPRAQREQFPLVAKFPESVVKPQLQQGPWNNSRLYQQDVPKAEEDSDEELDSSNKNTPKKRWRPRKELPKRQWILQEQVEFLETMMAKRQRKIIPKEKTSSRYEGIPEHNPSQYVLLEAPQFTSASSTATNDGGTANTSIKVTLLPTPNATIQFSQPKARKTMSMSEAEQAIENQRGKVTRFMMQDKRQLLHGTNTAPTNESRKRLFGKLNRKKAADGVDEDEDDIMGDLAFRNRKGGGSRARKELLNTLGDSGLKVDADGVLGGNNDSEFGRGQRFGRFKAENEAANNDNNGADGGAGANPGDVKDLAGSKSGVSNEASTGNDGLAMADDFYQRDVKAEYEELDYDANEQFDDDDVDAGETDMAFEGTGGYADDDEDDDADDDEMAGERPSGAEGLASLAGFRLMLAKARGEITPEQAAEAVENEEKRKVAAAAAALDQTGGRKNNNNSSLFSPSSNDPFARLMMLESTKNAQDKQKQLQQQKAAQKNSQLSSATLSSQEGSDTNHQQQHPMSIDDNANGNQLSNNETNGDHHGMTSTAGGTSAAAGGAAGGGMDPDAAAAAAAAAADLTDDMNNGGVQVDENGLRVVNLGSVRREIWLHHGTIPMKRLMKIFDIKSKWGKDRQNKFREVVKELCTMETDPLGGRMLVLKQHYSNMG